MDVYVQMYTLLVSIVLFCFWGGGSDVPKNSGMQALFVKEQGRQ